jgi:hypothetical protein
MCIDRYVVPVGLQQNANVCDLDGSGKPYYPADPDLLSHQGDRSKGGAVEVGAASQPYAVDMSCVDAATDAEVIARVDE